MALVLIVRSSRVQSHLPFHKLDLLSVRRLCLLNGPTIPEKPYWQVVNQDVVFFLYLQQIMGFATFLSLDGNLAPELQF